MVGNRRRTLRRLIWLAAAVCVVAVVLLKVSGRVNADISSTAIVLAALFAAYPVVFPAGEGPGTGTVVDHDGVARRLSRRLTDQEANQKARLLNFAATPALARLSAAKECISYHEGSQPAHCSWQDTFKAFWESPSKRLVILGSAGAGKTLMLLDLISQSEKLLGADRPLLIRVNIAQWRKNQSFLDFYTHQVSAERGIPADVVSDLLADRRIIPLLDGLDELDAEGQEKPERGLEAIRRLNAATSEEYPVNAPIILTCRTSHFQRLEQFQLHDKEPVIGLAGAWLLRLEPLNADQITKFLDKNLRAEAKARWGRVLRALNTLQKPPVVAVLGLPWRLVLAFSAYQNGGVPDQLLAGDGNVAEADLLPQFLRMAVQEKSTGVPGGNPVPRLKRQWLEAVEGEPARVARWLKAIAEYLEKDRAAGGGAGVFLIYEIYQMVNPRRLRLMYGICALIVIVIAGMVTFVTALSGPHPFPRIIAIAVAAVFLVSAAYVVALRPPSTPAGFTLIQAIQTPQGVLDLLISLLCALAASAFALGTQNTLLYRIVGGISCGFMAGLFFGFVHSKRLRARGVGLQYSEKPTDPLRGGLVESSIIGAVVGAIYVIVLLVSGAGPVKSILFGMLTFLAFAPILGLPMFSIVWTRYKLGLLILFFERRLPWRINAFMTWTYNAGLMRTAGLAYQFRHLRMQAWLAETDEAHLLTPLAVAKAGSEKNH